MSDETDFDITDYALPDARTTAPEANTTIVEIPEDSNAKVIIKCGSESIGIAWRDLYQMLSSAVSAWRIRGL